MRADTAMEARAGQDESSVLYSDSTIEPWAQCGRKEALAVPWLRIWLSGSLVDGWSGDDLPVYNSFVNGTWPARVIHLVT